MSGRHRDQDSPLSAPSQSCAWLTFGNGLTGSLQMAGVLKKENEEQSGKTCGVLGLSFFVGIDGTY